MSSRTPEGPLGGFTPTELGGGTADRPEIFPSPLIGEVDRWTTRMYLLAVRTPSLTRPRMITAGVPPELIDTCTEVLTEQGLLRATTPDTWEAIPPDVALPAMAARYETQANYLRDTSTELLQVYRAARLRTGDPAPGVTVLGNLEELSAAVEDVTAAATSQIWAAYDTSPRTTHLFGADLSWHRNRLFAVEGAPLERFTTFDSRMMQHPRAGDVLLARTESGEEIRFLNALPFSIVVADDTSAVIDLTSFDTSGAGSVLIQDRRIVLAVRALCQTWWRLATPLAWDSLGDIDRRSALILSMLAAGATDATMAARAGLSQRTVERRVSALMTQLGAATRFQAGVLAARRGWL
ncbi:MAG: helix-turn-helix transcriptional regulator [Mobilicoccus sp.]|nr:helix-turn-helix transcriptional regulator [Mobilicoccus sp.]